MKEKVKQYWLEALRSGEYKQTRGQLKDDEGYCCLGVLCDIYAKKKKEKGIGWDETNLFKSKTGTMRSYLPDDVKEYSGLNKNSPITLKYKGNQVGLVDLNDVKKLSFKKIAQLIEKQL